MFGGFIKKSANSALKNFEKSVGKLLIVYFVLTCISLIADLCCFFVGLSLISNYETIFSYPGTFILILSSVFFTLDLFYIIWAISFLIKLPDPQNKAVVLALSVGVFSKLNALFDDLNQNVSNQPEGPPNVTVEVEKSK